MKGYGNAPEENKKALVDGWLRTGDLVYYDERGYVFIKDRLKEVIKVSSELCCVFKSTVEILEAVYVILSFLFHFSALELFKKIVRVKAI